MRIITGSLGGRQFDAPSGHKTHPMSEKARGAIFSALGDIEGLTVLDTYAGSGALSYEAISRGAKYAVAIELDKSAQKIIQGNMESLKLADNMTLFPGNWRRWSNKQQNQTFDIVFCDPPYDRVLIRDIQRLSNHVKPQGLLVLSWPGHLKADDLDGFTRLKVKSFGDAQLVFYRRTSVK